MSKELKMEVFASKEPVKSVKLHVYEFHTSELYENKYRLIRSAVWKMRNVNAYGVFEDGSYIYTTEKISEEIPNATFRLTYLGEQELNVLDHKKVYSELIKHWITQKLRTVKIQKNSKEYYKYACRSNVTSRWIQTEKGFQTFYSGNRQISLERKYNFTVKILDDGKAYLKIDTSSVFSSNQTVYDYITQGMNPIGMEVKNEWGKNNQTGILTEICDYTVVDKIDFADSLKAYYTDMKKEGYRVENLPDQTPVVRVELQVGKIYPYYPQALKPVLTREKVGQIDARFSMAIEKYIKRDMITRIELDKDFIRDIGSIAQLGDLEFENDMCNVKELGYLKGKVESPALTCGQGKRLRCGEEFKEENLHRYEKNTFDAIVIDEAHHSAANSYKKVLDYFEPKLWLGMTATPDKRDDNLEGRNIYEIFNHQIAYEIRLQDAMEEDLLCPFHYFGIMDLDIIADAGKSSEEKVENFRYLTSEERVENVMKQAEYFGYSGDRVKGLIFCSRIDEAKELSKKFNDKGWRTLVVSGSDSEEARAAAIERLAGEESEDALDYIISVDIFSEGVDVPEINQVIMLRPTESPIVFIQQLGRGLRKAENKEYVVVLDFIGNYRNNFMIPIALSGDRSYNKDNIRRYVTEGGRVIPGASTIHFDEISRKRIFQAIDNANFSDIKLIRENYTNLKNKLGHIPALADFDKYGEMDVLRIFDNNSLGSYYKFLVKYEKEYTIRLSEDEEKAIEFISKKLASGKRIHELELLKRTLQYRHGIIGRLRKHLSEKYHCEMDEHCTENVINMMTNEFPTSAAKKTYAQCIFLKKERDDYGISDVYGKMLENPEFCAILEELVDFGISRYKVNYSYHYHDTNLVLYQKYTYEDACRLLNWERNEVPLNIGGYKYDKKTKTFPIFINYDKQDNISDTTKYEDHFVAENRLIAISKSGRSMDSEDVQNFLNATERGIDVQLFVRKNKDDKISKEFYYLGRVIATGNAKQFVMPNTDKTAVEIEWELETPVREDIYQYIVNE